MGNQADLENLDATPVTSFFSGWTTSTNSGMPPDVELPTDQDGDQLVITTLPSMSNLLVAFLMHGAFGGPSPANFSAVLFTSDGQQLTPYVATGSDIDMLLDPSLHLPVIQYFAFQLVQIPAADGLTLASMTASDLVNSPSAGAGGVIEAVSGAAGGPWTVRLIDPEQVGFPAHITNCEITLEAATSQYPRAVSYSCP